MKQGVYWDWRKGLMKLLVIVGGGLLIMLWSFISNAGFIVSHLDKFEWWFIFLGMLALLVVFQVWDWIEMAIGAIAGSHKDIVIPIVLGTTALIAFLTSGPSLYSFGFWLLMAIILTVNAKVQDECDHRRLARYSATTREQSKH